MPACDREDCRCPQPDESVAVWHVVISGFTQHRGDPTGSQKLWLRLRSLVAQKPGQAVEFFGWRSNWNQIAEWIWRCRPEERPPIVFIYAYSWGAGWGFVQLARELRNRGIRVRRAVLCDPVYRSGPLGFCWLAISRLMRPVIAAPANVDWLWYCYQAFDRWPNPRGHKVVAENPAETVVCNPRELVRTHHYMDDSAEWQDMAAGVAKGARPAPAYETERRRDGETEGRRDGGPRLLSLALSLCLSLALSLLTGCAGLKLSPVLERSGSRLSSRPTATKRDASAQGRAEKATAGHAAARMPPTRPCALLPRFNAGDFPTKVRERSGSWLSRPHRNQNPPRIECSRRDGKGLCRERWDASNSAPPRRFRAQAACLHAPPRAVS